MRRIFLWLAGNAWLRERVPRWPFAQRAVRRFLPGERLEDALAAAVTFREQGIPVLLTRLGENLTRIQDADGVADEYERIIGETAARDLDAQVSVKLTQLGFDLDGERTFQLVSRLARLAAGHGQMVWIDMESSSYAEGTIALYERLKAEHPNTGICLQAYLHRTAADIQRLLPLSPAIRLVKGAYAELSDIAWQTRREVDASFAGLVVSMLQARASGTDIRIGLGTHDVALIEQLDGHARAIGLPRSSFEVEMLYGIRVDQQRRLAREGYLVRDLIAYGEAWYPWYLRRLAERPANVLFVLRQMLPRVNVPGDALLEGVWNIMPTPFADDGELDAPSLATLTDFVIDRGVDGLTILGVLGEATKLTDVERSHVIDGVIGRAAGRVPVCVGVSAPSTSRAVGYALEARDRGAHSVMLAPPPLVRPNDGAVRAHYLAVAEAIGLPVVVQDHPASSGVWMSVDLLLDLAASDQRLRVIKLEDEPTPPKAGRLLAADPTLRVLGGLGGEMLIEELRRGCVGTMTGFGYAEILVDIVGRYRSGDHEGATLAFHRACPLIRFENQAGLNLPIRKLIYQRRGAIACARVRAPGPSLDPGTVADLDDLLTRLGLTSA